MIRARFLRRVGLSTNGNSNEQGCARYNCQNGIQPLFTGRDEIITLLSLSDPAPADRLSDLYVSYRGSMNR
jgi:hypothetical protein